MLEVRFCTVQSRAAPSFGQRRVCKNRHAMPLLCNAKPAGRDKKVVGMGSAGLDYLAQVAAFPEPDQKLRTENLQTQGGGNCANALTAAARLGVESVLVSKIGDDGVGDQIVAELQKDQIATEHVLRAKRSPSPFTYIIVDRTGGTRTCIHTPSAPLLPGELDVRFKEILEGATLIYFDGRLTEAAIPLAEAARAAGIPVLVEAERLRPSLESLLAHADFVSTSKSFPQAWTGEAALGDALLSTLHRLPRVAWLMTTLGSKGAVLVQRAPTDDGAAKEAVLDELLSELHSRAEQARPDEAASPACASHSGVIIREGGVADSGGPLLLRCARGAQEAQAAAARREQAAASEARANAGSSASKDYSMSASDADGTSADCAANILAHVFVATSAQLPKDAVIDTTGAGDASVGSLLYGLSKGMQIPAMLRLAAIVAAAKCTAVGARAGLPWSSDLRPDLL